MVYFSLPIVFHSPQGHVCIYPLIPLYDILFIFFVAFTNYVWYNIFEIYMQRILLCVRIHMHASKLQCNDIVDPLDSGHPLDNIIFKCPNQRKYPHFRGILTEGFHYNEKDIILYYTPCSCLLY